jgi:hypothetical protein
VVASGEGVHHASHWPDLPFHEFGCWQTLPVLAPSLQLRQSLPPHVMVVADRSGADVTAVGTEVSHHSVDGDLEKGAGRRVVTSALPGACGECVEAQRQGRCRCG